MSDALPRPRRRLLEALAEPGASARPDPFEPGRAIVAAPRNGVTVRIAAASGPELEALLSAGLAERRGGGVVIAAAGRARLARESAPEEASPFLAQHAALTRRTAPGERPTLVDEAESPLAWLARRRDRDGRPFLDPAALEAGERLRRDLTFAQMLPRVTANWSSAVASGRRAEGAADALDVAVAARQRVTQALAAAGGDLAGVLIDVCGFLKGLETIESERGWPARSGKVVLRIALARLAAHYGLASEARGPARAPLRGWSAADYAAGPEAVEA
ncbi:MAG: ATPase [Methylobacteriaceae bacterium]|nr:ATPase [Methylobacteriaceae bacterium]